MLEDRTLLTNYVVDAATDDADDVAGNMDGLISLREAITAAVTNMAFGDAPAGEAGGDTITFNGALAGATINLTPATPYVIGDGDLTIDGGNLGITIDGNNASQLLRITKTDGSNAVIQGGLTFEDGAAILIEGDGVITLTDLTVNNLAGAEGGGIRIDDSSIVTATGLTVTNNESQGVGGGISVRDNSRLTLSNSQVSDNEAVFTAFDDFDNHGGGLYVGPGAQATVNTVDFTNNLASLFQGGQIANFGNLEITNSNVTGDNMPGQEAIFGGGIANGDGAILTITDSTISNNIAFTSGGGLGNAGRATLNNVTINGNTAQERGGGIFNDRQGILIILNGSTISNNVAEGDSASNGGGGGIFNNGGGVGVGGGRLAISGGSTITGNMATGDLGSGGGIFTVNGVVTIDDSSVNGNSAVRAGGGIEMTTGIVELRNTQLNGNAALGGASAPGNGGGLHVTGLPGQVGFIRIFGGTVNNNMAAKEGGGLWNQVGNIMVVRDSAIVNGNTASGNEADDGGGGIFNNGGRLSVGEMAQITNNHANGALGSGGGIFTTESGVSVAGGTVISGNTAVRAGGGIEIVRGLLTITDSTVAMNQAVGGGPGAPGNGGGIHVTANNFPRVDVINSLIDQNTAATEGGGIWMSQNSVVLVRIGSSVTGNEAQGPAADDGGGGIFNQGGRLVINNASIEGNMATGAQGSGGGILSVNNVTTVENGMVRFNTAVRAGGGIEIINGLFESRNMMLGNNHALGGGAGAPGNGGGVHVTGNSNVRVNIFDSLISNNTAAREGGGLWNQLGAIMIIADGTLIEDNMAGSGGPTDGGGGLFNNGGRLAVLSSLILSNDATGNGGGILSPGGGLSVDNSTVAQNEATGNGGGIANNGDFMAHNSTFAQNVANSDDAGGGTGGGIFNGGTATLRNSLVAGNVVTTAMLLNDVAGNNLDGGSRHTLISHAASSGGLVDGAGGHIVGNGGVGFLPILDVVDPLADNGGTTMTYALATNSPAINAGNNAFARDTSGNLLNTDQRGFGFPRIQDGTVDMGAFEVQTP